MDTDLLVHMCLSRYDYSLHKKIYKVTKKCSHDLWVIENWNINVYLGEENKTFSQRKYDYEGNFFLFALCISCKGWKVAKLDHYLPFFRFENRDAAADRLNCCLKLNRELDGNDFAKVFKRHNDKITQSGGLNLIKEKIVPTNRDHSCKIFICTRLTCKTGSLGAGIALWIRLHLPFCRPGLKSQAYHLCLLHLWSNFVLYLSLCWEGNRNKQKEAGFGSYLKKPGSLEVSQILPHQHTGQPTKFAEKLSNQRRNQ